MLLDVRTYTCRPGTIKKVVAVEMPRPRDMGSAPAIVLQQELSRLVMEEQMRSQRSELGQKE